MRLSSGFIIATDDVANNHQKTKSVPGGQTGKRLFIENTSGYFSGQGMDLSGGSITISDGSSDRVLTFGFDMENDSQLSISSGGGAGNVNVAGQRIAAAIRGSTGGSINVTTLSGVSHLSSTDVVVTITHNLGAGHSTSVSFAQNGASADPNTHISVSVSGHVTQLTINQSNRGNFANLAGATMTLNDGGTSRTLTFTNGTVTNDSMIGVFLDSISVDDIENMYVRAINGTTGVSISATASSTTDNSNDLTVDIMGATGVSFTQGSASRAASDFITVSNISGGSTEIPVADDFITGSIVHNYSIGEPVAGKITLREDSETLGMFNVVIGSNDIRNVDASFLVTGSISGVNQPNASDAKRVKGDVLIITQGS